MREKLIELLETTVSKEEVDVYGEVCVSTSRVADHLIANDVVQVVRCKDCKHLVLTDEGEHNPNDCVCDYWMTDGLNDNDFCYYGERKEK
jgi:hypothetical protein